jgi:peroxiredoxin
MKNLIIILFILSICGCKEKKAETTGLEGKSIPSFSLLLLDSSTYVNTSDIHSKQPFVMFYVSPQCPFCKMQMNEIIDKMKLLKDIRFYIFSSWPVKDMRKFRDEYNLTKFQNVVVGIDQSEFFGKYYNVPGVPYMAIYNKESKLNRAFAGHVDTKLILEIAKN